MNLTARQRQIVELIRRHLDETGYPPTRAEIAGILGFRSPNAAEEHLKALARKGVIELIRGASRGIRLIEPAEPQGIPVVGRVAAGSPILAEEHVEERYSVDPQLFRPRADYLLRVRGMSMRDAGILDGDLLAVHHIRQAENGQIVVARLENEVTVKRFQRHGRWKHRVKLLSENPVFPDIEINLKEQDLIIEGLGVGLLRGNLGRPLGRS